VFHLPQFVRLFQTCGSPLGLQNDRVQFPLESQLKGFSGGRGLRFSIAR
jgi:hypothetical protein